MSDLVANILASVAEEETRQLGERVRAVNAHLARTGWARPGRSAWGYRWRKPTDEERAMGAPRAVLDVAPEVAPFVREAFARIDGGMPIRQVMRWIQTLPSSVRDARRLNHRSVQHVLVSPTYIACTEIDGELLPGRWPALIERAQWERVQRRIADHARIPHQASRRYLLTGLLRCPRCGGRVQGSTTAGGRGRRYQCNGIQRAYTSSLATNCYYSCTVAAIDGAVLAAVGAVAELLTGADGAFREALRRQWEFLRHPVGEGDQARRVKHLEQERDRAQERLRKAALLYVDGNLDRAGYDLARDAAQKDLAAAEAELEKVRGVAPAEALPPLDDVLRVLGGWARALREFDVAAQRDIRANLIERVTSSRTGFGKYDVRIDWTPLGEGLRRLAGVG